MAAERMLVAAPLGNWIVAAAAPGVAARKTPPGAVADDGVADLPGRGESDADRLGGIVGGSAGQGLQDQSRRHPFAAPVGDPEEIRPALQALQRRHRAWARLSAQAERRLRPFALRLATTLRPPTVAMRERKP